MQLKARLFEGLCNESLKKDCTALGCRWQPERGITHSKASLFEALCTYSKGASIYDVRQISGFFYFLPPPLSLSEIS